MICNIYQRDINYSCVESIGYILLTHYFQFDSYLTFGYWFCFSFYILCSVRKRLIWNGCHIFLKKFQMIFNSGNLLLNEFVYFWECRERNMRSSLHIHRQTTTDHFKTALCARSERILRSLYIDQSTNRCNLWLYQSPSNHSLNSSKTMQSVCVHGSYAFNIINLPYIHRNAQLLRLLLHGFD